MNLKKKTDEERLKLFLDLLEYIGIETGFTGDGDVLTHQILQITAGELVTYSQPEQLPHPLRLVTAEELGEPLN